MRYVNFIVILVLSATGLTSIAKGEIPQLVPEMKHRKKVDLKKAIIFSNARIRVAHKGQNTAGFVEIANHSPHDFQIIKVECDSARIVEMHISVEENHIHKMRPVSFIAVDQGETTVLKPGGLHIMLIDLNKDFVEGEFIDLTLTFDNGGKISVPFEVKTCCGHCH